MLRPVTRRILAVIVAGSIAAGLGACQSAPESPDPSASPSPSATVVEPSPSPSPSVSIAPPPPPAFDKAAHSIDDPLSAWVVVNKLRPLSPIDFVAPDLVAANVSYVSNPLMRPTAAEAMATMFAAAAAEGAGTLQVQNSYRSFATQTSTHNRLVAQLGQAAARAQSAQPGYSEHQTGLAADLVGVPATCSIQACFGETTQGIWLAANSWRFGYILRYPADKTLITGYIYEPWHFRYVGPELAAEMHSTGVTTLEEFFGLPAAPDYAG